MSHESLIAQLAADVTPVTPLPSPRVRALRWMLLALVAVALGLAVRGIRANWAMALADPMFLLSIALILATGVAAALTAMALAVPGVVSASWVKWLPIGLLVAWGGVVVSDVLLSGSVVSFARSGTSCLWKTWGIAVGPAAALLWLARRAAPLDWKWTSGLSALAALAFGVLGTEFICPVTAHGHVLAWHFVPVAVVTGVVFVVVALLQARHTRA